MSKLKGRSQEYEFGAVFGFDLRDDSQQKQRAPLSNPRYWQREQ